MKLGEEDWLSTLIEDMFVMYYVSLIAEVMATNSFLYVQLRSFIESLISVPNLNHYTMSKTLIY